MAKTLGIDQRDVRTKILTHITNGISARIKVGHPKKLFRNSFILFCVDIGLAKNVNNYV